MKNYIIALELFNQYQIECLDNDGDYTILFDTWLKGKINDADKTLAKEAGEILTIGELRELSRINAEVHLWLQDADGNTVFFAPGTIERHSNTSPEYTTELLIEGYTIPLDSPDDTLIDQLPDNGWNFTIRKW